MSNKKLPQEVINHWPEVLEEVDVDVIPLEYVKCVEVSFTTGELWILENEDGSEEANENLEESIEELFQEYEDIIEGVNFVLDVQKVKNDIQKRTALFMKKKK